MKQPVSRARAIAVAGTPAARLLAIALVLGAAIVAAMVAALVGRPGPTATTLATPVVVKRSLSTSAALFGDPLEAEIDVFSNDGTVRPQSIRVSTNFEPYRVAETRVDRSSQGNVSLLRTRISLECLTRGCLPPKGGARVLRFPPLAVTYRTGGRTARVLVPWAPLQLSSRLPRDTTIGVGIVDTAPPLEPRFERSPELLRTLLLVAAAVLGLVGAALVVTTLWPPSFLARRRRLRLTPLERSLLQVEEAARSDDETVRRRTLDDLATRLGDIPSPSLASRTRALAWGPSSPEPETLTMLVEQVRTTLNGASRA